MFCKVWGIEGREDGHVYRDDMADVSVLVLSELWVVAYARDVCDLTSRGGSQYLDVGLDLWRDDVFYSD